ncbi:uncharacterized protein LOC108465611 [Gossypium arboreum]|uniref:uncharacterized protein LOC108465611 n=1 Tax=Gossypium arboreum TaxID=29729 RepID=UPI0008195EAB|nr:uncharacterized protein LOC108465611 [Gossypium arboreum]XP_017621472.1 uncharacterized protein LOC108465611 [Gossypium arboreum]XP_017621473.1 uncharacterized protein LOC108465611 [Gossypium arboreum]XP_052881017.1 uncharacterized protein LOC108465611 [Gossypium arboreum]
MIYCHNYNHVIPCLHCHPHSYIRMVQHLIERCLLLYMNRQQCVKALAKYASIRPCITITVWRELEKENKDFFEAFSSSLSLQAFYGYIRRKPSYERKNQYWK